MSRSGAHEALVDHRLDLLIAELTRPVSMPECETASPMVAGDPMADEAAAHDEWLERTTLDGDL